MVCFVRNCKQPFQMNSDSLLVVRFYRGGPRHHATKGVTIMDGDYRSFLEKMISEAEELDPAGKIPRATKTRQMNVKVTEDFHVRVHVLASKLGVSMTELIERAIHALEEAVTGTR
jgi:hypothetical protein